MNRPQPASDYFVAGGAIAPERPCYVARPADQHLLQALREGRSCYVLGPRQIGKTSLMLRIARQLAEGGRRAVLLDLAQIGAREHRGDAGRWFYSFAYRILRELRIKAPLQAWWQERVALTVSQRLQEFFRDLVLGQMPHEVVVFIDDLECAETLPFAGEFLASLRACLNARTNDPDFARLSFVLLGVTSARRLCPEPSLGPFAISEAITLTDLTLPETMQLAPGLALADAEAREVLERVHYWTAGHPYLAQKVCRELTRGDNRPSVAAVDRFVEQRLLAPAAARSEPLLAHIAQRLRDSGRARARTLGLYGRVRKGMRVVADPGSPAQERLQLLGLVRESAHGRLVVRNRVFASVFTARWVNQNLPLDWRGLVTAAALGLLLVAVPVWYTQYLPRDQIAVLSAADADEGTLLDAYRRLRRLPGHADTADRLLAGVLERRSRRSDDLREVRTLHAILAVLPGRTAQADALLADFWRRRLELAEAAEQRDEALLAAREVFALDPAAGGAVAALVGNDYRHLKATLRWPEGIETWQLTDDGVVVVDGSYRVHSLDARGERLHPAFEVHALRGGGAGLDGSLTEPVPDALPTRDIELLLAGGRGDVVAAVPDASVGNGAVVLWSRASGEAIGRVERPIGLVRSGLALDGHRLLLQTDHRVTLHATDGGRLLLELSWPADTAAEIVLSSDHGHAAVMMRGRGRDRVRLVDLDDAEVVGEWSAPDEIAAAALGPGGEVLVIAGADQRLRAFDGRDGRVLGEARKPEVAQHVAIDRLGDWVSWQPRRGAGGWHRLPGLGEVRQHFRGADSGEWLREPVALDATGAMVVVAQGTSVQLLRLADGAALAPRLRHGGRATAPALSVEGRRLATWDGNALRLWQVDPPERQPQRSPVLSAATLGPDGRDAVLGFWDGRVIMLPAAELAAFGPLRTEIVDYLGHTAPVRALRISPDQSRIASASEDGVVRLWDALSGRPRPWYLRHGEGAPDDLVFSPDGARLLSVGAGSARLWDLDDGRLLRRFETGASPLAAAFSADGLRVAIGDAAANLMVWSLNEPSVAPQRLRADAAVTALMFHPAIDGVVISGDRAGRLQAWALDAGQRLGGALVLGGPVQALLAEGDRGMLAAITRDWRHRFALQRSALTHRGAHFLTRPITPGSARAEDGGSTLVALGPYDAPALWRLGEPAAQEAPPALDERDWSRVLGLTLDAAGNPVPRPAPRSPFEAIQRPDD